MTRKEKNLQLVRAAGLCLQCGTPALKYPDGRVRRKCQRCTQTERKRSTVRRVSRAVQKEPEMDDAAFDAQQELLWEKLKAELRK